MIVALQDSQVLQFDHGQAESFLESQCREHA